LSKFEYKYLTRLLKSCILKITDRELNEFEMEIKKGNCFSKNTCFDDEEKADG